MDILCSFSHKLIYDAEFGPFIGRFGPASLQQVDDLLRAFRGVERRPQATLDPLVDVSVANTRYILLQTVVVLELEDGTHVLLVQVKHTASIQNLLNDYGKAVHVAFGRAHVELRKVGVRYRELKLWRFP